MKEVVYEPREEMIAWAEETGGNRYRDDAKAIGVRDETGWRGVVVFDTFTTTGCWIHVVSDGTARWMTREFILRVFAYPFVQLQYPRLSAFVSERNTRSRQFCESFGFSREGTLRQAGEEGEDIIMFGMLRSECRWLPQTFSGKIGRPVL